MMATQQHNQQPMARLRGSLKGAGKRASIVGQKAKLGADLMVIDQKIKLRKQLFGEQLYDHLAKLSEQDPMFMIESDALDNIRGLFVTCYKDNKALMQKQKNQQLKLADQEEQRRCVNSRHGGTLSFDVPADTVGERILNAPKLARIAGNEAKIKTSMSVTNREMMANKHNFGIQCYAHLVELEKVDRWIPGDRDIRYYYDDARREIARYEILKDEKGDDIDYLDREEN